MDNLRGINIDVNPKNQPPGTYRFALNAVNNSNEGDMRSLSNEQGNEQDVSFPEGFIPIGDCLLRTNEHIYISTDDTYTRIDKRINGIISNIFYIKDFGYTQQNQVKIESKVINGCEDILVITDGVSTIKYINITERDQYLLTGETITSANADGEGWDLGLFNLSPNFTLPSADTTEVLDSSGALELGSYIIVPQYLTSNLDTSSYLQHIGVFPVYDEPFYGEYQSIDGGLSAIVDTTSKAIRIQFSNLDTSFSYLRLILISNIDGVVSANIIATLPFGSETLSYVITGNESKTAISLEELVIDNGIYDSAEDVKFYDNRLWLLNVKEKQVDHSVLQNAAFNIKAYWFTRTITAEHTGASDTKSSTYYLNYRSYMRDEVYAFGIQFRFKNGWVSRPYPLANRPKDTGFYISLPTNFEPNTWHNRLAPTTGWDSTLYQVGVDIPLADVEHLGFVTGAEDIGDGPGYVQRWRVFNTAVSDSGVPAGDGLHLSNGEFAYSESTDTYPNNSVYGTNAGAPIRDFKFPDAILTSIGRGDAGGMAGSTFETDILPSDYRIFPIGIGFTNIQIPDEYADEIEGYEIVRIKRDEFNSTVLDKGVLTKIVKTDFVAAADEDYIQQLMGTTFTDVVEADYTKTIDHQYQTLHNPISKFRNQIIGSYLKIEGEQEGKFASYIAGTAPTARVMMVPTQGFTDNAGFSEALYNRKIDSKDYVPADSLVNGNLDIKINNTEQQEGLFLKLSSALTYNKYVLGGNMYFLYVALKQLLSNQYGQVEGRVYIPTHFNLFTDTSCEVFGGDIFISPLTYRRCERFDSEYNPLNHYEDDADSSSENIQNRVLFKHYNESVINTNLRHEGVDASEVYYPKSGYDSIIDFIDIEADANADLIPNYYAYNEAFSQENDIKAFFGIPFGYNYDSDCLGEFPTRIVCSEKDNVESLVDSNKIFLPNNYRDLPKNKGKGLSLFVRADRLYAHLERSLYLIPVKDQSIKIGDVNAYFGTGEVLSIPPNELVTSNKGYGGLSSKWSHVETPYGVIFVSHEEKEVFLLSDTLESLTNIGISNWSFDNFKFKFLDDFRNLMGVSNLTLQYERYRNNVSKYGLGFHSTYDPRYERVLITKRDYRIKFTSGIGSGLFMGIYNSLITYPDGAIVWNTTDQVFEVVTDGGFGTEVRTPIDFYNEDYFEDCSFTLSFSFLSKSWVSFHSYIPLFYSYDKDFFYSYTTDNNYLYKHSNTADYQKFYGIRKPHIIDIILPGQGTANFTNIFLDTRASILDSTYNEWYDVENVTFSSFVAYNTKQCTGEHGIEILENYNEAENWNIDVSYARRLNNVWRIGNIRDIVSDRTIPFFTSQYSDISSSYYIDKVLNASALDYSKSQYKLNRMNDTWMGVRLTFDSMNEQVSPNNIKLTTNVIETLNYQSR